MNIAILLITLITISKRVFSEEFCLNDYGLLTLDCAALEQNKNHSEIMTNTIFDNANIRRCVSRYYPGAIKFKNCQLPAPPHKILERLSFIETVYLDNTGVAKIESGDFPQRNAIEKLSMTQNNISEIPALLFSNLPQIRNVDFSYNKISKVDPKAFNNLEMILAINLAHNFIETLDKELFSTIKFIDEIDLSYNQLEAFDFLSLQGLGTLKLNNNKIMRLDCNALPLSVPTSIDLSKNQLIEVDLNCNRTGGELTINLDDNLLENITLPASPLVNSLIILTASNNKIRNVSVESEVKSLTNLQLKQNNLTDVPDVFKHCSSLTHLDVSFNNIRELSAELSTEELRFLNLSNNHLTDLKCNAFPNSTAWQTQIDVSMNQLKHIELNCDKRFTWLILNVEDNFLENLTLPTSSLMSNMSSLYASRNKIKKVLIESDLNLIELKLANNSLSEILNIFKFCSSLKTLDLSFNRDISQLKSNIFIKMGKLERLLLRNTNLGHLEYGTLSYLKNLHVLDLAHNYLELFDFDWFYPPLNDFKELYLNDNNIREISGSSNMPATLPNLSVLNIANNFLDCGNMRQLIQDVSSTHAKLLLPPTITDIEDNTVHFNGVPCYEYMNK